MVVIGSRDDEIQQRRIANRGTTNERNPDLSGYCSATTYRGGTITMTSSYVTGRWNNTWNNIAVRNNNNNSRLENRIVGREGNMSLVRDDQNGRLVFVDDPEPIKSINLKLELIDYF